MTATAPPEHIMLTRGDARLEVLAQGKGPTIVLLPSLGRGATDFDDIAGRLAGAGFRVLRPEPRGIGQSTGPWQGIKLEDLAADANFTGRLLIGVTPGLFFSGFAYRGNAISRYHKQAPSDRSGQWISQHLLEPWLAFYDPDFALDVVVRRQAWPVRAGVPPSKPVRKLRVSEIDRNTAMWRKVEVDTEYRDLARSIWAQNFTGPPPPGMNTPAKAKAVYDKQIERAVKAVATLRARGVQMVFVRPPSVGAYYAFEQKVLPRAITWDVLLQRTGVPGIHFEDYPTLQGYESPEWSHLTASEASRFTAALVPIVEREFLLQKK